MRTIRFYTDGGSRGNPGPAASAIYLPDQNEYIGIYVGDSRTNNEAEALALILGLRHSAYAGYDAVAVCSDSTLVVNQALGKWSVKAPTMVPLMDEIHSLLHGFAMHNLQYVPREKNREADWAVNQVLDRAKNGERLTCPTVITTPS